MTYFDSIIGQDSIKAHLSELVSRNALPHSLLFYGESGLGLAIVHSLIEQHHGKIEVSSKLNQGTTFRIFFPNEKTANLTAKTK